MFQSRLNISNIFSKIYWSRTPFGPMNLKSVLTVLFTLNRAARCRGEPGEHPALCDRAAAGGRGAQGRLRDHPQGGRVPFPAQLL